MKAAKRTGKPVGNAFTLVETVMAIAVSSIVMLGCCALMFDMVNVSEFIERGWTLRGHADGVDKFLRSMAMSSRFTDASKIEETLSANSSGTVVVAKLPKDVRTTQYYLCFGIQEDIPFLPAFRELSPEKICYLVLDDEGLSIVWQFSQPEDEDGEKAVFKSVVSRWVKELVYIYSDGDSWEEEKQIDTGRQAVPDYIKLLFERKGEKIERIIKLSGMLDFQIAK